MSRNKNKQYHILIVDDEPLIRESLYEILRIEGYNAQMAQSGEEALEVMRHTPMDVVLTDMKLPRLSGIELLEQTKKSFPETEVILITGFGTIETAVQAIQKGAFDYITKPINDQEIKNLICKIVEKNQILTENKRLRAIVAQTQRCSFCDLIGGSEKMQKIYNIVESVASSNATILITGESGTGKGLVARAIHKSDVHRKNKPFIEVSCGALSETLLESELFGHVKGAFTGAIKDKEGRFEFSKNGTIFLDEIDAFSLNLQVKLLRILQDGTFERVGDNISRKTDARIIVATNQTIFDLVTQGKFREDLYYRINVINIDLPSLRERKDDIDLLVDHFLKKHSISNHKNLAGISSDVRGLFWEYHWPGNIRELENTLEGSVIMCKGKIIAATDIPHIDKFFLRGPKTNNDKPLKKVLEEPEKDLILSILKECTWSRNQAASRLGINRTTLYNKMRKYNIPFHRPPKKQYRIS